MDAVNFYADAGCYNHSIRLTRAHNLDAEIMRFAVRATPSLMLVTPLAVLAYILPLPNILPIPYYPYSL